MRRLIFPILIGICICGVLICSFQMVKENNRTKENMSGMEWELSKNTEVNLSKLLLEENEPEETLSCLYYEEEQKESLKNNDLNRTIQVTAIKVFGNSSLVFSKNYPLTQNDTSECLISKRTAMELFGDVNLNGVIVTYQNKDYVVRDVIMDEREMFVYESDKETDSFSYLYCKQFDKTLGVETMNAYFLENGLIGSQVQINAQSKNLQALITKENTFYEIIYLRNLFQMIKLSHIIVFLLILIAALVICAWRQYRSTEKKL